MSTLGIVGSRAITDKDFVFGLIDRNLPAIENSVGSVDTICSGGATGIDSLAEQYAESRGLKLVVHYPDWKRNGRGAGMVRNHDIVHWSDFVLAIWDGRSSGTKHSISLCAKLGKPVIVEKISNTSIDETKGKLVLL